MHRTIPGFRTLHFGDVVDIHLLDDERDNNAVIAQRLAALLRERYELAGEGVEFALGIAVEAADALIKMAFRREAEGDTAVLNEAKALINELSRFRNAEMVWCQEEPKNMGAWSFIDPYLEWVLAHIDAKYQRVRYTGRPAAASPATGLMSKHLAQLAAFLEDALGG